MADTIAFRTQGSEGRHCLFIHGFGSDRLSWLGTTPFLPKPLVIHTLDLPGHGESSTDVGDGSPLELSRRVEVALDTRKLSRLHIIGHSLGGGIAMMLAARRPDLASGLCLIASAGLGQSIDRDFLTNFPQAADSHAVAILLQRLVVRPRLIGKQIVDRVLQQLARDGARAALAKVACGIVAHEDQIHGPAATVAATALPRMVIWGAEDEINPLSSERLATFGGSQHVIAGAGHLPHVEAARQTNLLLADFLNLGGS